MIKRKLWGLLYILIVLGTLAAAEWGCRTVSVMVEAAPLKRGNCIIIDAGMAERTAVRPPAGGCWKVHTIWKFPSA